MTSSIFESANLDKHRGYLLRLAGRALPVQYRRRLGVSDIVQKTLLNAYTAKSTYYGQTKGQQVAWLRKILLNTIAQATRNHRAKKRDIRRDCSIENANGPSSMKIPYPLASDASTPSQQFVRRESERLIVNAIELIPYQQRQVIKLRYWNNMTLKEISETIGKSTTATAGLLHRGTKTLRSLMESKPK